MSSGAEAADSRSPWSAGPRCVRWSNWRRWRSSWSCRSSRWEGRTWGFSSFWFLVNRWNTVKRCETVFFRGKNTRFFLVFFLHVVVLWVVYWSRSRVYFLTTWVGFCSLFLSKNWRAKGLLLIRLLRFNGFWPFPFYTNPQRRTVHGKVYKLLPAARWTVALLGALLVLMVGLLWPSGWACLDVERMLLQGKSKSLSKIQKRLRPYS